MESEYGKPNVAQNPQAARSAVNFSTVSLNGKKASYTEIKYPTRYIPVGRRCAWSPELLVVVSVSARDQSLRGAGWRVRQMRLDRRVVNRFHYCRSVRRRAPHSCCRLSMLDSHTVSIIHSPTES